MSVRKRENEKRLDVLVSFKISLESDDIFVTKAHMARRKNW